MLRERASAPDRTMDRDHRRFENHTPVSIQMLDGLLEKLSKEVFPLASCFTLLASSRDQGGSRRCRQTGGPTAVRHLTHLGEPQSAAGVPALVSDHRADQPWLAGMVVLRRQLTFSSITSPIYYCQKPLSALVGYCLIDSSSRMRDACGGV